MDQAPGPHHRLLHFFRHLQTLYFYRLRPEPREEGITVLLESEQRVFVSLADVCRVAALETAFLKLLHVDVRTSLAIYNSAMMF